MTLPDSSPPTSVLSPGALVGQRYRILRIRGKGGMGEIYEAEHIVTGRFVALKTLSRRLSEDPEARLRFAREARMLGRVNSRFVVSVLDASIPPTGTDGVPYIAMELLEGRNGETLLFREQSVSGPTMYADVPEALPTREVGRLLLEVAKGLAALHAVDVVHRDFSPDNVFLERKDGAVTAKLIDLGISKRVSSGTGPAMPDDLITRTGEIIGKAAYMAPAQLRGSKLVDARVDIHAFAVVAREFLSGRRAPDWNDPRLPLGLRDWYERATDNANSDCFETMEEASHALERVLEAVDTTPVRAPSTGPQEPSVLASRWRVAVLAAVVIPLLGTLAFLWRGRATADDRPMIAASAVTAPSPRKPPEPTGRSSQAADVSLPTSVPRSQAAPSDSRGTPASTRGSTRDGRTPRVPERPTTFPPAELLPSQGAGNDVDPRIAVDPWPQASETAGSSDAER